MKKENRQLLVRVFGKQLTRDIQFRIEYWDNVCGHTLELYTNMEMIFSENITEKRTKGLLLELIFDKIRKSLHLQTVNSL